MTRNQHIDKFGLKRNTWRSVAAMLSLAIIFILVGQKYQAWKEAEFLKWEKTIISPLSNVLVRTVYAKEEEKQKNFDRIVVDSIMELWEPDGLDEQVKAIHCFSSEGVTNNHPRKEKHFDEQAYNFNTNGTWDYGVAQWNQVHGQSIQDLQGYKKQLELAYQLYKKHGFSPWYGVGCH